MVQIKRNRILGQKIKDAKEEKAKKKNIDMNKYRNRLMVNEQTKTIPLSIYFRMRETVGKDGFASSWTQQIIKL